MFVMLLENKLLLAPIHEGIQVSSIQPGEDNRVKGSRIKLTKCLECS